MGVKEEIPYGFIEEGKIFLGAWGDQEDRQIGEIKNNDKESSVDYFKQKFEELDKKISALEAKIAESQNKGSFQMQLKHLQENIREHDGLGDYQSLSERIERQISLIEDMIQKNRQRNSEIKKSLIEELKVAIEIVNWREATDQLKEVKDRWIKTGNAEDSENEELNAEFWNIHNDFYERKQAFYEDKQKLIRHYEKNYQDLIEKASQLSGLSQAERKKRESELKQQWQDNGAVPSEIYKPLISQFNEALKKNNEALDIKKLIEQLQEEAKKPLEKKQLAFKKLHSQLKSFRPAGKEDKEFKTKAFELLFYLQELDFAYSLSSRKNKDFEKKSNPEKKAAIIHVLRELLDRDKIELKQIEENSLTFKSHNNSFNKMLDKKVNQQKQKIKVKESILAELKS